jgi:colicin import membrane protein
MEAPILSPRKTSREDLISGMGGSILAHALIFSLALIIPWLTPNRSYQVPYYSVNLVSMQDMGMGPAPGQGKAGQQHEGIKSQGDHKTAPSHHTSSAPLVPVRKLNVGEPVKRTESDIQKLDSPSIPKVPSSSMSTASVDKSLEKLIQKPKIPESHPVLSGDGDKSGSAKETGTGDPHAKGGAQASSGTGQKAGEATGGGGAKGGGGGGSPGGSPDGAQMALAQRIYWTAVQDAIRRQWALPDSLKAQNLVAVLLLTVRRDGKILNVQFEQKSGQPLFDESVERAVRKADPLPAFPQIYSPAQAEAVLRFRPQDLTR